MILIDANLLLYAYDASSAVHEPARRWLEATFNGKERVGLGLVTVLAFMRIATNRAVYEDPLSTEDALAIVRTWLEQPQVQLANPGDRHWQILGDVALKGQVRGAHLMDAHLAALTVEHGATLATSDRGFARFPGLRFRDPLGR